MFGWPICGELNSVLRVSLIWPPWFWLENLVDHWGSQNVCPVESIRSFRLQLAVVATWPRGELNSTVCFGTEFCHCVQKVLINAIGLFVVGAMTCIRNDG